MDFIIEDGVLTRYTGPGGNVTVPEGVEAIGPSAFDECAGLTGVTLPESLRAIGFHAFMECRGLTEVTIPENVRTIGPWAFFYCKGLRSITLLGGKTAPAVKTEDPFEDVDAPIIAPGIPLGDMPAFWKPRAAWGFAEERDQYPEARQEEYLKYIRSQRKRLYPLAVCHEGLLLLMLTEGLIPPKDVRALLDEAERQGSAAAKMMIQAYQP